MGRRELSCVSACLVLLAAFASAQEQVGRTPPSNTQKQSGTIGSSGKSEAGSQNQAGLGTQTDSPQKQTGQPNQKAIPNLPDAPSETVHLTTHQKFETFVKRTYSPYTFAAAAANATWAQMWGDWYGYGGGMQGWSKRFGASLANTEVRTFFSSFALPVVFHQDPRYHPLRKGGFFPRMWYAGTRTLVTRSDDGDRMFNYSEVFGVLFTSSVQNAYYPRRDRGFDETVQRFIGGFGSDATSNVLAEFSPELKRAARKIIPKRAQKMEKKLPDSVRRGIPGMAE